jgi:hypothetical protein
LKKKKKIYNDVIDHFICCLFVCPSSRLNERHAANGVKEWKSRPTARQKYEVSVVLGIYGLKATDAIVESQGCSELTTRKEWAILLPLHLISSPEVVTSVQN